MFPVAHQLSRRGTLVQVCEAMSEDRRGDPPVSPRAAELRVLRHSLLVTGRTARASTSTPAAGAAETRRHSTADLRGVTLPQSMSAGLR
jgi:hypothetical protein